MKICVKPFDVDQCETWHLVGLVGGIMKALGNHSMISPECLQYELVSLDSELQSVRIIMELSLSARDSVISFHLSSSSSASGRIMLPCNAPGPPTLTPSYQGAKPWLGG